jgi:hypothetical protein
MAGNYPFHGKLHRSTHHTDPTPGVTESGTDPVAAPSAPFKGIFHTVLEGNSYQWYNAYTYIKTNSANFARVDTDNTFQKNITILGNYVIKFVPNKITGNVNVTAVSNVMIQGIGTSFDTSNLNVRLLYNFFSL